VTISTVIGSTRLKWEPFTFEGGGGGKIEVKDKQLRMLGAGRFAFRDPQQAVFQSDRSTWRRHWLKVGTTHAGSRRRIFSSRLRDPAGSFDGSTLKPN
jgi:hypothetical protein